MKVRTVTFDRLTGDELAAWSTIQRAHPAFYSPFFCPRFTQLVADVRADVEVGVVEQGGELVGFFPFQRGKSNAGLPVCGWLSEFHALVASPDVACDPRELLRACRLSSWRFDHLAPIHASFERYAWSSEDSPYINLSDGFDCFVAQRANAASLMKEYRQKGRKLQREFGPLRCEFHVADQGVLAKCIEWKREHARRTGRVDILENSWAVKLLHNTLACQHEDFSPVMSAFFVGEQAASIILGMRSGDVFHAWFTAFDRQLAKRSPGILHWLDFLKAAESAGIRRIILGKGQEEHKRRLMTGADRVLQGCIDSRATVAVARRAWRQARQSIRASRLGASAQVRTNIVSRITTWFAVR